MKTTRWFIERGTVTNGWINSAHNPPEGWDSEEVAIAWCKNVLPSVCLGINVNTRVVSREVWVAAKAVVKVVSRVVVLEINNAKWHRKESEYGIEWFHSDDNNDKFVEVYYSSDGKNWHHNYSGDGAVCDEPEVERIWREHNN